MRRLFALFARSHRSAGRRRAFRPHTRHAWLAVGALLLWLSVAATPVRAQAVNASADSPPAPADSALQTPAHRSADIPARADADEQDIQAIVHRAQAPDAAQRYEEALARHAKAIQQLAERSSKSDLAVLSVRRLESLQRHWLLYERSVAQTRAELARTINAQSEDVSDLANRRAAWQATAHTAGLPPALRERVEELIATIEDAEKVLSVPLARLLDLGRTGGALAAQGQQGISAVSSMVEDQDRRLVSMDTPPLWLALREAASREPVSAGLTRSLDIERTFASSYDAANVRWLPALAAGAVLLLPAMVWLRYRARLLVATGQATEPSMRALSRPWAAWLVLVLIGAVVVVPNGMLLADKLVNWTLNGTSRRLHVGVSSGYSVSPRQTELLVNIARAVDGIALSPAPIALLTGLTPGALEFSVRAWTSPGSDWVAVHSALSVAIRDGLAEACIEVPLPQREMHLRNVSGAVVPQSC